MKALMVLLLFFLWMNKSEAQILKKIGGRIKDDAAWRVSNKIDNEVRKGIDSVSTMPKKIKDKKKDKKKHSETGFTKNPDKNAGTANNTKMPLQQRAVSCFLNPIKKNT